MNTVTQRCPQARVRRQVLHRGEEAVSNLQHQAVPEEHPQLQGDAVQRV